MPSAPSLNASPARAAPPSAPLPAPPFALRGIDHVVLRVHDLAASERFYREVLGCPVVHRQPALGLVHLRAGDALIDLRAGASARPADPAPSVQPAVDHVALRLDRFDAAALRAHLARHGVEGLAWADANFGANGEGPSVYLHDPDAHVLELKGPARPAGESA